jgi:hypothetical protein
MYSPRKYFRDPTEQRRALESVGDFFQAAELDLYDASVCAFAPFAVAATAQDVGAVAPQVSSAEAGFSYIYSELASFRWNVFRPYSPAECWPPQKIFDIIKREFADNHWGGTLNLTNFGKAEVPRLQSRLATMRGIKPNQSYPIMTVSKFLHFYNPALFPIYDTGVIYNKVLNGYWKSDFRGFCDRERLPYSVFMNKDTIDFLPSYMRWASSLLSTAHSGFMQVFTSWLGEEPGADLSRRSFDPKTIYARAFEYTVVGAATAEDW